MTKKSQLNGDRLEYSFYKYLIDTYNLVFYDTSSKQRYQCLADKFKDTILYSLNDFHNNFVIEGSFTKIKLLTDDNGCCGNSNDVELYDANDAFIGISLKNNNCDIKHPRPKSFGGLFQNSYNNKYQLLNDKWYNKIHHLEQFNQMSNSDKLKLYKEFTTLFIDNLRNISSNDLINFCTSSENTHYIIVRKNNNTYDVWQNNIPDIKSFKINVLSESSFLVKFSNKFILKFRLHTASSKITKNLSLKFAITYDSKPIIKL